MIKIADLPAVRAQLDRDAATAREQPVPDKQAAVVEYARAPDGDGHETALRAQGGQR